MPESCKKLDKQLFNIYQPRTIVPKQRE
ncbi:Bgt-51207 [Blumeria graminis f. sp. tritici]|uniref:Bgt-51207 n=1 Tax=Blumeria graminis f. sp. tritici TaxID=62690 RepID=A0A9X9MN57_BLUGR|nr:Bgt-51207 [Blumeria graminis f. sp. tritici]